MSFISSAHFVQYIYFATFTGFRGASQTRTDLKKRIPDNIKIDVEKTKDRIMFDVRYCPSCYVNGNSGSSELKRSVKL